MDLRKRIKTLLRDYRVFPVAKPANFDWQWINYYFHRFTGDNPLGFSARCIATYAWAVSKNLAPSESMKMWQWANPQFKHTHKALDDAKEAGYKLINMWRFHTGQLSICYDTEAEKNDLKDETLSSTEPPKASVHGQACAETSALFEL